MWQHLNTSLFCLKYIRTISTSSSAFREKKNAGRILLLHRNPKRYFFFFVVYLVVLFVLKSSSVILVLKKSWCSCRLSLILEKLSGKVLSISIRGTSNIINNCSFCQSSENYSKMRKPFCSSKCYGYSNVHSPTIQNNF